MFTTIILGAGKSTRMKANKSKLLFDIAGKPIIEHIVDSVQKCKSKNIICVVNKESHELVKLLKSKKVDVAYQKNINGTAGAAESALSLLKTKNSPVLILCGDAPFISSRSVRAITKKLNGYDACVGTVELDIPRGYGRIIRSKNKIVEIVEEKIAARAAARADKDFETADAVRAELTEMGVELLDSPEGTTWTVP